MALFNNALTSPVRQIKAKVELYNGSTIASTFTYQDALQSVNIERTGEDSKFFGFGFSTKASIKLRDKDKEINPTTANHNKIYFGVGSENYYDGFPQLYVTEVNRDEKTGALTITCYDKIYFLSQYTFNDLGLEEPYTINDVADAIADIIGKPILKKNVGDDPFELSYEEGANVDGSEDLRSILDDIAEATQTIYYLTNSNLVFRRIDFSDGSDISIARSSQFNFKQKTNRRLREICSTTELGDNISAEIPLTGTTQYIRDNVFWDLREDRAELVENAINAVGGLVLPQFDLEWRGNFTAEYGDTLLIADKNDSIVKAVLLNDTIEYNGALKQKTNWHYEDSEGETASNPSNLGEALKATFAKVDKANKQITLMASEVADGQETLANIQITTNELSSTVQQIENNLNESVEDLNGDIESLMRRVDASVTAEDVRIEIKSQLKEAGAVEAITTSTGFTFNEDGLSIEKADNEMNTKITEDGMTVLKNDEPMLTANNQGVTARNLKAETYLIIGKNSRFEDVGDERTACYWIGS